MNDLLLDLSGKLDAAREGVFRDVADACRVLGIPFLIVGACARDLILELHYGLPTYRATNDIDFGIRVETWDQFEGLKKVLTETGRYLSTASQTQRLGSVQGTVIDIVPFGGIEDPATRSIAWPPDHAVVLSTLGFEEAYQHAIVVRLAADLTISISSLAGLTLMKLIAWKGRHTLKDAKDLKLILSEYLSAGNDLRLEAGEHSDLLDGEKFIDIESTGARLLGRDLALLLVDRSRQVVLDVLGDPTELASAMASGSLDIDEEFERARRLLEMLRQGISDQP